MDSVGPSRQQCWWPASLEMAEELSPSKWRKSIILAMGYEVTQILRMSDSSGSKVCLGQGTRGPFIVRTVEQPKSQSFVLVDTDTHRLGQAKREILVL